MNASPNTREHIQEHPHAAALIKANKELIKGFSSATLKLRSSELCSFFVIFPLSFSFFH